MAQICSNNKRPDLKSIHSYLVKMEKLKELSVQYLQQIILQLEYEGKLVNKILKEQVRFLQPKLNLLLIHLKVPIPYFQ